MVAMETFDAFYSYLLYYKVHYVVITHVTFRNRLDQTAQNCHHVKMEGNVWIHVANLVIDVYVVI